MAEKKPKENGKKTSKTKKILNWVFFGVFGTLLGTLALFNIVNKLNNGNGFIFGSQFPMVLTDSMEPQYNVGDVLVINKVKNFEDLTEDYRLGDDGLEDSDDDATVVDGTSTITITNGSIIDLSFYYDITGSGKEYSVTHRLSKIVIRKDITEGNGRYQFTAHGINTDSDQCAVNDGDCTNQTQIFNENKVIGRVIRVSGFLTVVYNTFTSIWGLLILLLIPGGYLIVTSAIDIIKTLKESENVSTPKTDITPALGGDILSQLSPEDLERLKKDLLNELLEKGGKK